MASYYEVVSTFWPIGRFMDGELKLSLLARLSQGHSQSGGRAAAGGALYWACRSCPRRSRTSSTASSRRSSSSDGEILPGEQFYLLKVIYSDRVIRPRELEFLRELRRCEAKSVTPEFREDLPAGVSIAERATLIAPSMYVASHRPWVGRTIQDLSIVKSDTSPYRRSAQCQDLHEYYHVTILSNLVRGYDQLRGVIPRRRFPKAPIRAASICSPRSTLKSA